MKIRTLFSIIYVMLFVLVFYVHSASDYLQGDIMEPWEGGPSYYSKWSNGPSSDPNFFPITVWYQTTSSGYFYQKMGINFFNYWGPSINANETDLINLKKYSMSGVTAYSSLYANSVNSDVIKAWMHEKDEPDNAVSGTTTPVPPASIISDYNAMVLKDSTRPVFLGLGQGVAIDSWYGRGDRTNHPEDYIEYTKGADIITFDVYPMNQAPWVMGVDAAWKYTFMTQLSGNIWYVAKGVDNLRKASEYKKPVWVWLECTNYNTKTTCNLTPVETKAEAWMALIHGARGIGYFCHILSPSVIQAGVLNDAAMKTAITSINTSIKTNAPILNSQTVSNAVTVSTENTANPVDVMVKRYAGFTYIYAVSMRPGTPTATFTLRDFTGTSSVEVVDESRTITAINGVFQDTFPNWGVHIYKVATQSDTNILISKENTDFKVKQNHNSNELFFDSNEFIIKIELFTIAGAKIKSKTINDFHGSIAFNSTYNKILLLSAFTKSNKIVRKISLN